ncbi:MAG: zinc-dependent metalloprotease [Bacteroidota bacterium]
MSKHLLLLIMLAFSQYVFAQNWTNTKNIWEQVDIKRPDLIKNKFHALAEIKLFRLNERVLIEQLNKVPQEKAASMHFEFNKELETIVLLPNGSGEMLTFSIVETQILPPVLANKYPSIKAYKGYLTDQPNSAVYLDMSGNGLHVMVLKSNGENIFIDPVEINDERFYAFYKSENKVNNNNWMCHSDTGKFIGDTTNNNEHTKSNICGMRTFRLALSCTGEYAQYFGGTREAALAAMHTTINRVNGIFERDLSVTLQLAEENDKLIFLNPHTDPFSNYNTWNLIEENQKVCDELIGEGNYDMGHVFSTGGGGLAQLRSVCLNGLKAQGATGISVPEGDPFNIDYVAHEIGHQLGASHTHSNDCNRHEPTSVEPGSGSSIMSYAGICVPNIQLNSDAYFHSINIQEIKDHLQNDQVSCAIINTNNSEIIVDAGNDFIIPQLTPFKLTGSVHQEENTGSFVYNWEQVDNEIAIMPPVQNNNVGPLFRSRPPAEKPFRFFPKLSSLVNNLDDTWEVLPGCEREMNFIFSARNIAGGNSCIDLDYMKITVSDNAGPFKIIGTGLQAWSGGDIQEIKWDVAGTNLSPVNCTAVDIFFSKDGGYTYPYELAKNAPNSGSANILVPNIHTDIGRIMVKASDNVFFAISQNDFTVKPGADNWVVADMDYRPEKNKSDFSDNNPDNEHTEIGHDIQKLHAFPNPIKDFLNIEFYQHFNGGPTISILDSMGRERFNKTLLYKKSGVRRVRIDLSDLTPGCYILKVNESSSSEMVKLIKM